MPFEYWIDPEAGLLNVRCSGVVTDADLAGIQGELFSEGSYARATLMLVDFTPAERFELSADVIHMIAERAGPKRRAIAVASEVGYGLARMFQMVTEGMGYETRVFRDVEEARTWLLE